MIQRKQSVTGNLYSTRTTNRKRKKKYGKNEHRENVNITLYITLPTNKIYWKSMDKSVFFSHFFALSMSNAQCSSNVHSVCHYKWSSVMVFCSLLLTMPCSMPTNITSKFFSKWKAAHTCSGSHSHTGNRFDIKCISKHHHRCHSVGINGIITWSRISYYYYIFMENCSLFDE